MWTPPSKQYFYPRSPRGERLLPYWQGSILARFLSTLPARGATVPTAETCAVPAAISIHAPREGSDALCSGQRLDSLKFLSTLPARGATLGWRCRCDCGNISIHAPREGSDCVSSA